MANGRSLGRTKKNPVTVSGPWLAMPLDFLRSRAWAELSLHGARMLMDLCAGLGRNAKGNGDLSAAPAVMRPKGWVSTATRVAALKELEDAGLIVITRRGDRRRCTLYAVTLWPLQCDFSKLDHGPGCCTTADWHVRADRAEHPTMAAPAKWNTTRKGDIGLPARGQAAANMHPLGDKPNQPERGFAPAAGTKAPVSGNAVDPPRDTSLELPSAEGDSDLGVRPGTGSAKGRRDSLAPLTM